MLRGKGCGKANSIPCGGAAADGSTSYNVIITVNGGTFVERLTLGSSGSHDGSITATINGGTFYQGVCASTLTSESQSFNSDTALEINGGTFYARISAAFSSIGTYNGTYTVRINGGEFAHLVGLEGTEALSGNITSLLESKIDLKEKETGTYTFFCSLESNFISVRCFTNTKSMAFTKVIVLFPFFMCHPNVNF